MWFWDGNIWWLGALMMIVMIIFWGGIIALIIWAVMRFTRGTGSNTPQRSDPLDIAKERYARGEITKEEFDRIKRDLS